MSNMPLTRNQTNAAAQSKTGGAESAETSTAKDSAKQGSTSSESDPPRRDSPDNCSICLGPFIDKSFTNSCAHSFCFVCLKQWSKVKAECPLCKQPFFRIFHNIRSSQMYDTYELPRQPPNQVNQYNFLDYVRGGLTTFTAPTHHYLSLSQPFDADLTLSNFSRFQFRHRRYDRYLNPMSIQGEHQYSYSGPAVNPATHVCAANWPRGPEDFRREVYRHNLGPPAVILGNENSTYRLTPAMVAASSHRLHRIMPWLTRELRVLLRNHQSVRLAISMIQPLLTQVSVDSVYFHDRVATLIGRRSRVFIQEFLAFANSALSMQAFDRKAMYHRRDESVAPSSPSSTSSENDVVEVTDVSPDSVVVGTFAGTQTSSLPLDLRRSGWDSPTPGPSWSNIGSRDPSVQAVPIDRVSVSSESDDPVFIPHLRDSDSNNSRAGSDIIFVKYDKPWEERSPIHLTSESEKEAESERIKKKKRSKHKKRRKQSIEKNEVVKKDKSHKTSKGKSQSKEKSKSSSKGESGEERSGNFHKRHHSMSSPDARRPKRHKKSKDRREMSSDPNKDRELVDRLFAEAFANQKVHVSTIEEKKADSPRSGKDKERSSRSSNKDKSKKKKKSKSRSRDSHSPSYSHSFKKHHSGHKKSSNAARLSQTSTSERNHTHHRASSTEGDRGPMPPGRPSHRDSLDLDRDAVSQPHSSNSISHSVTSGFQPPPYLPLPETVQHIPVNLWVSTWPALPVSHTYHAPHPRPPSTTVPGTSHNVPQSTSSTFPPATSPRTTQGPSNAALDSHLILSESSTEDDSDDAPDRQIPSLKNVDSRTMHWLETHCPDLGRLQPNSSPVTEVRNDSASSTTSNSSSSSSSDTSISDIIQQRQPLETAMMTVERDTEDINVNVEVVSIESGEEDIVICSSTSDFDSDDVHCLDEEPPPVQKSMTASSCKEIDPAPSTSSTTEGPRTSMATIPFLPDFENPVVETSSKSSLFLPSGSKTFQPFKLQRKSALTHQGKDPFFPSMSHSSDEDDETVHTSDSLNPQKSQLIEANTFSPQVLEGSAVPLANPISTLGLDLIKDTVVTSVAGTNEEQNNQKYAVESKMSLPDGGEQWKCSTSTNQSTNVHTSGTVQIHFPSSTFSTTGSSMFPALSSLPQSTQSGTSLLPSNLNYLPYSSLPPPPPTALSFPQSLPFSIPPSGAQPPSLAVHFPYNPLSPMLTQTQTHSLLPPIYPSVNQNSADTTFTLAQQVTHVTSGNGSSSSLQSKTKEGKGPATVTVNNGIGSEKSVNSCHSEMLTGDNLQNMNPSQLGHSGEYDKSNPSLESAIICSQPTGPTFAVSAEMMDSHPQQEEMNEQVCSGIPFSSYCAHKSDAQSTHDFLDPEENASCTPAEPDISTAHVLETNFHNLLASLNSFVDKSSNSDERSAIDATSSCSSESKDTGSAQNLPFDVNNERKSSSPAPFDNSEYETPNVHVSDGQSLD